MMLLMLVKPGRGELMYHVVCRWVVSCKCWSPDLKGYREKDKTQSFAFHVYVSNTFPVTQRALWNDQWKIPQREGVFTITHCKPINISIYIKIYIKINYYFIQRVLYSWCVWWKEHTKCQHPLMEWIKKHYWNGKSGRQKWWESDKREI